MFNSNKYKNTKTNTEKKSEFEYIKTLSFIGLGASGSYILNNSNEEGINIVPKVTVVKSTTPQTVFFDFNRHISISTAAVESFFSKFTTGITFDITKSAYNFDEYDLNAKFNFVSFKNNLLVATCSPGVTNAAEQTYVSESFDAIPTFTLTSSKVLYTDSNKFLLTNNVPCSSNSFISAGIKENDILEFFDKKYRVESITKKINTNTEELILSTSINESVVVPLLQMNVYNTINVYKQASIDNIAQQLPTRPTPTPVTSTTYP